jgi:hypothetical protein
MSCAIRWSSLGQPSVSFQVPQNTKRLVLSLGGSSQIGSLGPVLKPDTRTVRISNGAKIATASFHQRDFDLRSRYANQKPVRFARIDIDRPRLDPFRTDLSLNFFPTRKWTVTAAWRSHGDSKATAVIERLECCGQAREWRVYG